MTKRRDNDAKARKIKNKKNDKYDKKWKVLRSRAIAQYRLAEWFENYSSDKEEEENPPKQDNIDYLMMNDEFIMSIFNFVFNV